MSLSGVALLGRHVIILAYMVLKVFKLGFSLRVLNMHDLIKNTADTVFFIM